ncbi:MAG: hypothetical protein Q4B09_05380 [Lachnospiraceae bacterium]|nr:hypothetical protein [Lachnospiraceae bacterium]
MDKRVCGYIERGMIAEIINGKYVIKSLDRVGITTPPLEPVDKSAYKVGDSVYYFYFADGTGRIICGFENK